MTVSTIQIDEQQLSGQKTSLQFWSEWTQHQDYLLHRCRYWMGGNMTDAEDALSQAMIKAWEKWSKAPSRIKNPKAWLTRLTHNLCVDLHRKSGRQAIPSDTIEMDESLTSKSHSPEENILNDELHCLILDEVHNLPTKLQETVKYYYLNEMNARDIALKLHTNENNIYKRLQKGRERLRERLNQYLYLSTSTDKIVASNSLKSMDSETPVSSLELDFALTKQEILLA